MTMSSTNSHSDVSSGDDDELALCIVLERSRVDTGNMFGSSAMSHVAHRYSVDADADPSRRVRICEVRLILR
jgi:hypothetical protein